MPRMTKKQLEDKYAASLEEIDDLRDRIRQLASANNKNAAEAEVANSKCIKLQGKIEKAKDAIVTIGECDFPGVHITRPSWDYAGPSEDIDPREISAGARYLIHIYDRLSGSRE